MAVDTYNAPLRTLPPQRCSVAKSLSKYFPLFPKTFPTFGKQLKNLIKSPQNKKNHGKLGFKKKSFFCGEKTSLTLGYFPRLGNTARSVRRERSGTCNGIMTTSTVPSYS